MGVSLAGQLLASADWSLVCDAAFRDFLRFPTDFPPPVFKVDFRGGGGRKSVPSLSFQASIESNVGLLKSSSGRWFLEEVKV